MTGFGTLDLSTIELIVQRVSERARLDRQAAQSASIDSLHFAPGVLFECSGIDPEQGKFTAYALYLNAAPKSRFEFSRSKLYSEKDLETGLIDLGELIKKAGVTFQMYCGEPFQIFHPWGAVMDLYAPKISSEKLCEVLKSANTFRAHK